MKVNKKKIFWYVIFALMAVISILAIVFSSSVFGVIDEDGVTVSIFTKLQSDVGNVVLSKIIGYVPLIIKSIQFITLEIVIVTILTFILTKGFNGSKKQITISKMVANLIKYLAWIVGIITVLSIFGFDTTALITSAGVLSLVVGLGAQSLIADIIAGISIVFDDQFEVGDIVSIDGYRGTIDEIGIRTTKIVGWNGNVKIINNSKITTLINESKNDVYASCNVDIDYGENIYEVEKVIKDNVKAVSAKIPDLKSDIVYKGVSALKDSGVTLLLIAKTDSDHVYQVQRDMNKEIKMLLDENGITIPFNQITISNRD